MRVSARGVASALSLGAAAAGIAYTAFAVIRLRAFGRGVERERTARESTACERGVFHPGHDSAGIAATAAERAGVARQPSITILKPVHGLEAGLEENLRSFCVQEYTGRWNAVLGVLRADDVALPALQRVAAAYPQRVTVVVGDGVARCRNPKIANVLSMLDEMSAGPDGRPFDADIVVIADSDMRVTPGYLDAIAGPFTDPQVGAVTAVYRGEPADDALASALGAMWISEQFAPSTLVANAIEPLAYTFGSTMAVRSTVLREIGGLAALGDHLADDHVLGRLVAGRGYRVALAPYVVVNVVAEPSMRALVRHELRWARTIRAVRPASYLGIIVTYPLVLAVVHATLATDRRRALAVVVLAALARLVLHRTAHAELGTQRTPPATHIPLREALGAAVWALGLGGRTVRWRDSDFAVSTAGELAAG